MLEFQAPPRFQTGALGRNTAPGGGEKGGSAPVTHDHHWSALALHDADTVLSVRAAGRLVQRLRR
ncbi:hypothetical protein GCM10010393_58940 [Streptomyces gobitricini]|uniref:Uncharacterized protein n=1 Tax=Streptomyces gobitricini TaxID=68211 RepID=A0ABN3NBA0_9ACTN